MPNCPTARTGRGSHYLFKANGSGLANVVFAPGLQLKCKGGYIVAPPSRHASGHVYAWVAGHGLADVPLKPLPEAIGWMVAAAHAKGNGAAKDDLHDLFGGLKPEQVFLEIEQLAPDSGDQWRQLMLRVIRSLVNRGWRDDAILLPVPPRDLARPRFHARADRRVRARGNPAHPTQGQASPSPTKTPSTRTMPSCAETTGRPPAPGTAVRDGLARRSAEPGQGPARLRHDGAALRRERQRQDPDRHIPRPARRARPRLVRPQGPAGLRRSISRPKAGTACTCAFMPGAGTMASSPKDTLPFRTIPARVDLCKSDADLTSVIANIKAARPSSGRAS